MVRRHLLKTILLSSMALLFMANGALPFQTQSFTLDPAFPAKIPLNTEVTIKVRVTPVSGGTLPSIDNIQFDGIEGLLRLKSKTDEGAGVYSFTFEAVKLADLAELTVKVGDRVGETLVFKEKKVSFSIVPLITKDTLELSSVDLNADNVAVKHQSEATVRLRLKSGTAIPGDALKVISDSPDIAAPSINDSVLLIRGRNPGKAKVTISAFGRDVTTLNVQVTETIKEIRAGDQTLKKGDSKPLTDLGIQIITSTGVVSTDLTKLVFFSSKPTVVRISTDGKTLETVDPGEAELQIVAKDDASKSKTINVKVLQKPVKVVLDAGGDNTILVRQKRTIQATVQDEAQRAVPDITVKFECQGSNCDAINLIPKANNSVDVLGIKDAEAVKIVARVETPTGISSAEFVVRVIGAGQITDFRPLQIRLDMLDEQAGKDLFGRKAVDEYYIAKVQLFNKIKKTDTEFFGDSILVYSESLQVRVALDVKCKKDDTFSECSGKEAKWVPITAGMIQSYFDSMFSLTPPMSGTEPQSRPNEVDPCKIKAPQGFVGLYRPYSFETIANTHDRRDERSLRSRILTVLNGSISFTSFVTAVAVPGPGSDLPLGLDKSNNLLIPSFERLFPSMKEVQRQNILTMVMRQLEEIPFGGSIERKIFFPKGALEGIWPGHRVRISGVSTYDSCATVAIIKKVAQP